MTAIPGKKKLSFWEEHKEHEVKRKCWDKGYYVDIVSVTPFKAEVIIRHSKLVDETKRHYNSRFRTTTKVVETIKCRQLNKDCKEKLYRLQLDWYRKIYEKKIK